MATRDFDIEIIEKNDSHEPELEVVEASADSDIVSEDNLPKAVEIDESETYSPVIEYSEWQTPEDFQNYIVASTRQVPPVFDGSRNSLRRAFNYLRTVQAELIEGVEQDAPYAKLTEDNLRTLDTIEEGIEQALTQIAEVVEHGLTKKATKSSAYAYYVNPFLYSCARVLINAKVSQGKNIEDIFGKLDTKYSFTDRERLELHFLLNDMGHPIRSSAVDHVDMMEQYFA